MTTTEEIYNKFKKEQPNLESIRKTSDKNRSIARTTIFIYVIIALISILFQNGITIALFIGIIPMLIIVHLLTKNRISFEQNFEAIIQKYLNELPNVLGSNIGYQFSGDLSIPKLSLFFNTQLNPFELQATHQIQIQNDTHNLSAANIDFVHPSSKNRLVEFYWKKSLLICLNYETGMTGRNILVPEFYLTNHNNIEDEDRKISRVMPLTKYPWKLSFDASPFLSKYVLFPENKIDKFDMNPTLQKKLEIILSKHFKRKDKFLSLTEDKICLLVFNKTMFKPDIKQSISDHNFFNDFKDEILELEKMSELIKSE